MGELKLRWLGQNGYLLSDGNTTLCIDPYLSDAVDRVAKRGRMVKAPLPPQDLRADAVICTHDHLDHLDVDAIPLMPKETTLFLAPTDAKETLLSCGVMHYLPFDEGERYTVGAFELRAVFADHSVPAVGVLIRHGDLLLYFSGDTEYHERLETLAEEPIDLMFICINGKLGNMNAEDAVRLTRILSPRVGIPTHYGMFESNTEKPEAYTACLSNAVALEHDREYRAKEILEYV